MTRPPAHDPFGMAAGGVATIEDAAPRSLALLDGGEIIELSLKPSLWYMPLVAGRTVLVCGLLWAIVARVAPPVQWSASSALLAGIVLVAVSRVVLAMLEWASRLYILTNRRVIRFRGVMSVKVSENLLTRLARAELRQSNWQRMLRIGTIVLEPLNGSAAMVWEHVSQPRAVIEQVNKAISRARNGS